MDVEGAEWAVLDALVRAKEPLAFTQLQARSDTTLGCALSKTE